MNEFIITLYFNSTKDEFNSHLYTIGEHGYYRFNKDHIEPLTDKEINYLKDNIINISGLFTRQSLYGRLEIDKKKSHIIINSTNQTHIYKGIDEWFWVWDSYTNGGIYYKCDRFDGLVQFLTDSKLIKSC